MATTPKQNLTVSLPPDTIRKARILAAKRSTSISGLVAEQIDSLVVNDEEYQRAMQSAIRRMKQGFNLGGTYPATREELHDRKNLR